MSEKPIISAPAAGMRVVAGFEAGKGAVVLLAGFGLLSLLHKDLQDFANKLVDFLHLNPAGHYTSVFIELMAGFSSKRLWSLAALACAYSFMRFAEAYGLWRNRRWAQWFAVLSGAAYVPIEVYELSRGISATKVSVLLVNIAIVLYVLYRLWVRRATHAAAD